ncbi:DUF3560 domain-containing protein [Clavibacter michiganensis]|uniref:DUF3560 domain-containing protein n=1 Tax=Clavibacter michiganensis TaxID=28447 RepID=UPI00292D6CA1|nr:DUF3560 domain-containing protein [Clavibacter michiganensis]
MNVSEITTSPSVDAESSALTITHTHEEGTLIEGTSRGDGTAEILKREGWRWGRSIAAWYVPHSRDRLPNPWKIQRTVAALRMAGFTVAMNIVTDIRPTAEVEAAKIERQADRVDALDAKAERKAAAEVAADERAAAALRRLPEGGEPIKVGHHSEGRHRNAIAKAHTAMARAVEAGRDAEHARGRADAARITTNARYSPVTVANRIEKLGSELRKLERRVTEHVYDSERGYRPASAEEQARRAEKLAPYLEEKRDQVAYWEGVRAEQIATGRATGYDRTNVQKGDHVKIRGSWHRIARVNPKTVSVETDYTWTRTAPYAEIQDRRRPK